ncbi:MAG: site-specific integrase [Bacteroidetes bacterium]|nr:site-specific integrase [Bacteroidota bacterium]
MTSAKLFLDTRRPNKNGEYRIKIRIIHDRIPKEIKLKYSCKESQWDGNGVKYYPNSGEVNAYLVSELAKAHKVITKNINEIDGLTADEVKELVVNYDPDGQKRNGRMTLKEWGDILVKRTRKANKNGTANWYRYTVNAIINFNTGKDIPMSKIDYTFLKEFEADHLSRGGSINGVAMYFRGLRSILNKANNEYDECNNYPFLKYKIKEKKTPKRALKIDVFNTIRNLNIDKDKNKVQLADWHAQNYFLFMFNNRGMNFIDLAKLKKDQIVETVYNGKELVEGRLRYVRSKNGKSFSIKLTDESIRILNDYNVHDKQSNDFVFPIGFSDSKNGLDTYNQKRKRYNKRFTGLAKMAGLDIKITSYVIRHSWASIAKSRGVSKDIIGESLGHDDPKVTEIYLENFENEVLDEANELIVGR